MGRSLLLLGAALVVATGVAIAQNAAETPRDGMPAAGSAPAAGANLPADAGPPVADAGQPARVYHDRYGRRYVLDRDGNRVYR